MKIKLLIVSILAWAFSIINTSGWGIVHNTPLWTNIVIVISYFFNRNRGTSIIKTQNRNLSLLILISFIIIPLVKEGSWEGLSYLMMIPLVYSCSKIKITDREISKSCNVIAILGILVLLIYSQTSILSGWNDNQIAMCGLFSYLFYTISLYGNFSKKKLFAGSLISIIYIYLLFKYTDSRSVAIFVIVAFASSYYDKIVRLKIKNRKRFVFHSLSVPIYIAILLCVITISPLYDSLNTVSLTLFDKSAFNGRGELWLESLFRLIDSLFVGEGSFTMNHHNSSVAVLEVWGLIGYYCWFKVLTMVMSHIKQYVDDNIVLGCFVSFFLIFWQQSFDLGLVSPSPNMIPYVIIGFGLARVNTLRRNGVN